MILVFGKEGQLARELARELARSDPRARLAGRAMFDLTQPGTGGAALCDWIIAQAPAAVINAAAYTAVDRAEQEEPLATTLNATAPGAMARACAALGIPFVHVSTDYVFDGAGDAPFAPDAPVAPLGAYGRSKSRGEAAVRAAGGVHAILRTSWVFSAHGTNFVTTMLRLGAERDSLRVVADQIGGPTPARDLAQACLTIADRLRHAPHLSGTWHFAGAPDTSWAGFAREIMAAAALPCRIDDIPSADYPTPARRPLNSRLDCSGLASLGLMRPDWRKGLHEVISELKGTA